MSVGPATSSVAASIRSVAHRLSPSVGDAARMIGEHSDGPFVVAVAGRLKAGKSTLVNALLGRDVAPTAVGECTKVVARFIRSSSEHVTVHGRDGSRRQVQLANGAVPADVGGGEIDHLDVYLATTALDRVVIVDTPGLASVVADRSSRTTEFLDLDPSSRRACAGADAIIYLLNDDARADDVAVLRSFRSVAGDHLGLACLAVLNKADQVTGGLDAANKRVASMATELAGFAAGVVAVVAVAGEARRCGLIANTDLDALTSLADLDAGTRRELCSDLDSFEFGSGLDPVDANRLLRKIGLFGISVLLDELARCPTDRAGALAALDRASQLHEVDAHLQRLERRADAIKASRALALLEQLLYAPDADADDRAMVAGMLADLRASRTLDCIEQVTALDAAAATPGTLTADELHELDLLFGDPRNVLPADPEAMHAGAWASARRWQEIAASPGSPVRRQAARAARHAYLAAWERTDATWATEECHET
ncbi:MAG: dynamin family protein [Actinomycetota bacterium]|nr:dynamin family protein [Actinomycetota bacterium]